MEELKIAAKMENTKTVLDFVEERLSVCPQKIRNQIGITVDEIFSNIASYAYDSGNGEAVVRVSADSIITLEFEDKGMAYDPLAKEDPNTALPAEEREIGGLGIFMVKNMMDSVSYRREGNKNILSIKKSIIK